MAKGSSRDPELESLLMVLFVPTVILLAPVLLVGGLVWGVLHGFIAATRYFIEGLHKARAIARQREHKETETRPDAEPAYKSFLFGPAQVTTHMALNQTAWAMGRLLEYLGELDDNTFIGGLLSFGAYCAVPTVYLVGFPILIIYASALIVLATVGTILGSVLYVTMRMLETIQMAVLRVKAVCPECAHVSRPPIFVCDCGRQHSKLVPSAYGVFRRQCLCGNMLPTMIALGRNTKLMSVCAAKNCPSALNMHVGRTRDVHIAIVGGQSSGKTCFSVQALRQMMAQLDGGEKGTLEFIEGDQQRIFGEEIELLKRGQAARKTVANNPRFVRSRMLLYTPPGGKNNTLIYFYDLGGEFFEDQNLMLSRGFVPHLDAIILALDPFSIPAVAKAYDRGGSVRRDALPSYSWLPADLVERTMNALERAMGTKRARTVPTAVVIMKTDVGGIEKVVGDSAVRRVMAASRKPIAYADAMHRVCRDVLQRQWNQARLLGLVDEGFPSARFFSCSALGRPVAGGSARDFTPKRVELPLIWAFSEVGIRGLAKGKPTQPQTASAPAPAPQASGLEAGE